MSVSIPPSLPSSLNQSNASINQSAERISSGKQINSAADDAAGLTIATEFSTQSRGQTQAIRNAGDGISLSQTASGALSSVVDNVQRIRELSVQAANGSYTDEDRALLQNEVSLLTEQVQDTLKNTEFNGNSLFDRNEALRFQVGPNAGDTVDIPANTLAEGSNEAGLNSVSVATQEQANNSIAVADTLLAQFSSAASEFGATQNQFESRIDTLEQDRIASESSRSRIEDTDIAKAASQLSADNIREQAGIAVQAQANQNRGNVLELLK